MVRRHRLIEEFLVRALDVPWEDVHARGRGARTRGQRPAAGAHRRVARPSDPRPARDPIPAGRTVAHVERWTTPLSQAPAGAAFRVERVRDRDRTALRYLGELGVRPGVVLDVVEQAPFGGPLWVRSTGRRHALGAVLAGLVFGVPA